MRPLYEYTAALVCHVFFWLLRLSSMLEVNSNSDLRAKMLFSIVTCTRALRCWRVIRTREKSRLLYAPCMYALNLSSARLLIELNG
jgi:hypothetical protein